MMGLGRVRRWVDKWFPNRQILIRSNDSVYQIRLSRYLQISLAFAGVALIIWTVVVSGGSWYLSQRLATREAQLFRSELSYNRLITRVTESQRRFGEITAQMEDTHRNLLSMAEKNLKLQARVQDYTSKLKDSEKEKVRISSLRTSMDNQMSALQNQIDGITNRNLALRDELETVETVMSRVMRERDQAIERAKGLQVDLRDARERIADLHTVQRQTMERVTASADNTILKLQHVLTLTGLEQNDIGLPRQKPEISSEQEEELGVDTDTGTALDSDTIEPVSPPESTPVAEDTKPSSIKPADSKEHADAAVGGPFIAFEPEHPQDEAFVNVALTLRDRMDELDRLKDRVAHTPLGRPANDVYMSSGFGKRKDPFTGRWAFHSGVDLAGHLKTHVFATAPGVVTHAARTGAYGNMVEIDHGNGVRTRYGHLFKILVKNGQTVTKGEDVGLMGSTGRSTGSHVHYEVRINGKAVNPISFIKAGQYVFENTEKSKNDG